MALSLHTTPTYKVEYGRNAINGWDEIAKFIDFLYEKRREEILKEINGEKPNTHWGDVYINEEETDIEIPFIVLEELKNDTTWGEVAKIILENSDKSNAEAHLSVW